MNFRLKIILNALGICSVLVLLFYLFFLPQFNLTQEKRHEIIEIDERSDQLLNIVSEYADIDKLIETEKKREHFLREVLPPLKTSPDMIYMISSEIQKAKINVLSLRQDDLQTTKYDNLDVYELELSFSLQANFFTLIDFLRSIYNNNNIIQIRSIQIMRDTKMYPVLYVTINMIIFFT